MDGTRNGCEESLIGTVAASHLDAVADFGIGFDKLAHHLGRAASLGRESTDDVKYMQNEPCGLAEFG
jgi:hypothetical protein